MRPFPENFVLYCCSKLYLKVPDDRYQRNLFKKQLSTVVPTVLYTFEIYTFSAMFEVRTIHSNRALSCKICFVSGPRAKTAFSMSTSLFVTKTTNEGF